ncbi:MAG: peptidyl-prolyl cis-trans isomerase [Nitrospirota bacterium]|nr:peptidyl-prolyl cis-trans isomerase [Nitrospirota bacterium]
MIEQRQFIQHTAPAILLGLLLFGCVRKEETAQPQRPAAVAPEVKVLATVNGDPITLAELEERFQRSGLKPEKDAVLQVKEEFLNRLIERRMLLKEAQRRRFKVGLPEINQLIEVMKKEQGRDVKGQLADMGVDFEKWKSDRWEDMMIEKLVQREVAGPVRVSAAEVRRYYQDNPQEFERPEQVRVRQIVVSSEQEAHRLLDQIQQGADFAELARKSSTAPEAEEGGDLGYFTMGDMPGEFNVVFGLAKGGVSGVVKSPYGFHLFKLESRRKAGKQSLEEVSKEITERLQRQKQDQRYQKWLSELRARTKFVVNYEALR